MPTDERRNVAHVTTVHNWDDVRIFHKMCLSLAGRGYDVHLIAPVDGTFTSGGVRVHGFPRQSARLGRILIHPLRALRLIWRIKPGLVHLHDPELWPAALILQALGFKAVIDAHEDYPNDLLQKAWLPPPLRKPLSWGVGLLARLSGRLLSGVVAATPTIAQAFGADRATVLRNYPVLGELEPLDDRAYNERPNAFGYVGGVTEQRGVGVMVQAISLLRKDVPGATLRLAGRFDSPQLRTVMETERGWEGVDYHEWLGRDEVRELLSSVRAGLVVLAPTPTYSVSLPIKMFEYMMAGLPVIASNFVFWRNLVDPPDCIFFVDPTKPQEVAEAMKWVLDHPGEAEAMGSRGRARVVSEFNWSCEEVKLFALYDGLLGVG